jgi:hypothetical protein
MIQHRPEENSEETEAWIRQLREELATLGLRPADGPLEGLSPNPATGMDAVRSASSGHLLNPLLPLRPIQTAPTFRKGPSQE